MRERERESTRLKARSIERKEEEARKKEEDGEREIKKERRKEERNGAKKRIFNNIRLPFGTFLANPFFVPSNEEELKVLKS